MEEPAEHTPTNRREAHQKKIESDSIQTISRYTRSRAAPEWTLTEMLILVREVCSAEEECLGLSVYQKWKIVSENCGVLDVMRSANQCRRQWEMMLSDYKKIKEWELQSGIGSFWKVNVDQMKEVVGVLFLFDQELYDLINELLTTREAGPNSRADSGSEGLINLADDDGDNEFNSVLTAPKALNKAVRVRSTKKPKTTKPPPQARKIDKEHEIAEKLHENSQAIQEILQRSLAEDPCEKFTEAEINLKRQQADELVKAFGDLLGSLNQFVELVEQCD
ncbi:hypothetical protein AMTRI_Chr01g136460 [Amborella trichopoda]|uniref:Myb-like domain-containing protein n=1 Tax=Amborella trichopoda TaxID=13333 RepID=W1PRA5_AMBTC|nr:trihelix transcription factor ASR3 [Amborella trichopoda]ERN12567.1 hypothetical protein AMTR_s00025p00211830 [Amborella trichopoda]|eukprot:XP_006850986.1 trihelix transcription factor ASR3 [Amborella trichopoda]